MLTDKDRDAIQVLGTLRTISKELADINAKLDAAMLAHIGIAQRLDRLAAVADLFESLAGDDGEPLSLSKLLRMLVSAGKGG